MEPDKEQKAQQELMFKLSMFEQQMQQLQQQMQVVEESITEISSLNLGIEELKEGKNKEILSPVGRGIFLRTKLLSEDLIVDIGGKNFVKKSIYETKKIIEDQIKKLENIRDELGKKIEEINGKFTKTVMEAQKKEKED